MADSTTEKTVTVDVKKNEKEENPTSLVVSDDDLLRQQLTSLLICSYDTKKKIKRLQHNIASTNADLKKKEMRQKHVEHSLKELYVKIVERRQVERNARQCPICLTYVAHDSKEVAVLRGSFLLLHSQCIEAWIQKNPSLKPESEKIVLSGQRAYMNSTFHRFLQN
jgi:hypothetical protein